MKKIPLILFILVASLSFGEFTNFRKLDIGQGLSSNYVSSIVQDETGFLWFGTKLGLNRYDSIQFEQFYHQPFDEESLVHNQIQTMYKDPLGYIWLGTYGGISRYNPEDNRFISFSHTASDPTSLSDNVVVSVFRDSQGELWVGTLNGLSRLQEESGQFINYLPDDTTPGSIGNNVIRSVMEDSLKNLWVGTYKGLALYQRDTDSFKNIPVNDSEDSLPSPFVLSIVQAPEDKLWVGTWDGGVSLFDPVTEKVLKTYSLADNRVYTMLLDREGTLWIGTWGGGLFSLNPETEQIASFTADSESEYSISHNIIYSLFEDKGGILWVGTHGGGINKWDKQKNTIRFLSEFSSQDNQLLSGSITAVETDSQGKIWMGTHNSGINLYNPDTDTTRTFSVNEENPGGIPNNIIQQINLDNKGDLWFSTNDGITLYNSDSGDFESFELHGEKEDKYTATAVYQDRRGRYWVGTYNRGIDLWDRETGKIQSFQNIKNDPTSLSANLVRDIIEDANGNIWIGTNFGLCRYNEDTKNFIRYNYNPKDPKSLADNSVKTLFVDNKERLWVGTDGGGLNLYNPSTNQFSHFTTDIGFSNNSVTGIEEDPLGLLWLVSPTVIHIFDPESQSIVETLSENQGLIGPEFTGAISIDSDNNVLLGSTRGLNIIDPREFRRTDYPSRVLIKSIKILGEELVFDPPLYNIDEITLNHNQNNISFEFSALDFSRISRKSFYYRLEGFDQNWINSEGSNLAVYTNLPHGRYKLTTKDYDYRDSKQSKPATLTIIIEPPLWRTKVAYFVYLLVLALGTYSIVRKVRRRFILQNEELKEEQRLKLELEQKVKERTRELEIATEEAKAATLAKSMFLANVSHDLRTPLNSILGYSEILYNENQCAEPEYPKSIISESKKLLELINSLLELTQIEAGKIKINMGTLDISAFLQDIKKSYKSLVDDKLIQFYMETEGDLPLYILTDIQKLQRIIDNLITNAIKFTPRGKITLRIHPTENGNFLKFQIIDTGIGIPQDRIHTIFEQFEQIDNSLTRSVAGAGLGTTIARQFVHLLNGAIGISSKEGVGTEVWFTIPIITAQSIRQNDDDQDSFNGDFSGIFSNLKILVAEDYKPNQEVLLAHFRITQAQLTMVHNGKEAIDKLKLEPFDLVLMDVHMPLMDGLEATRLLRKNPDTKAIPIIGLTADAFQDRVQECLDAGMNDVLTKPINQLALVNAITKVTIGGHLPLASSEPVISTNKIIDLPRLNKELNDDSTLSLSLVYGFLKTGGESLNKISQALEEEDYSTLHRECHALKGGALNIFAESLANIAGEMEGLAKNKKSISHLMPQLEQEFQILKDYIQTH